MANEHVANKFKAAWVVFAQTCGHFWAPEPSYQAWFAHYLISQFGIDRVAREPIIHVRNFSESALKTKIGGGEVRPDVVVTRTPGIMMPHYANRLGKASDKSGLGLLKELAVLSELKIGASTQVGLDMRSLTRDVDKLRLLLTEFTLQYPGCEPPLAYLCVLDNHGRKQFNFEALKQYVDTEAPRVTLLTDSSDTRPPITEDLLIAR